MSYTNEDFVAEIKRRYEYFKPKLADLDACTGNTPDQTFIKIEVFAFLAAILPVMLSKLDGDKT